LRYHRGEVTLNHYWVRKGMKGKNHKQNGIHISQVRS
jgi:hypothetical protein